MQFKFIKIKRVWLFLIIVIIAFLAGYGLSYYQSRAQLQHYRERFKEINRILEETRSAQQEAIRRAEHLQGELDKATRRVHDLQTRIDRIGASASKVERGIAGAIDGADESAKLISEFIKELERIQKGSRGKNP